MDRFEHFEVVFNQQDTGAGLRVGRPAALGHRVMRTEDQIEQGAFCLTGINFCGPEPLQKRGFHFDRGGKIRPIQMFRLR